MVKYLVFGLAFILQSCMKKDIEEYTGPIDTIWTVVDEQTQKPLPGVDFVIYSGSDKDTIAHAISDSAGKIALKFQNTEHSSYSAFLKYYQKKTDQTRIQKNFPGKTIALIPVGTVNLIVDASDSGSWISFLNVPVSNGPEPIEVIENGFYKKYQCEGEANKELNFTWKVGYNGLVADKDTTVKVLHKDTITVKISF